MSVRELVVLGTGSQVPSRHRNHNGYLLRWDGEGLLFDPGEGTQRQMTFAGVSASSLTRICLTHFHGDHCLGVPGVLQRLSLDDVPRIHAHYPVQGQEFFSRLRHASIFHEVTDVREKPIESGGIVATGPFGELWARPLDHDIDTFGYLLVEPNRRNMVPGLLEQVGVRGPDVGILVRDGHIRVNGRDVLLDEVSVERPGQRFAFIMDTRLCDSVFALAENADLLVIESTFLHQDAQLAEAYGHLTARQAARVANECGVHTLVLTHFSQRYQEPHRFYAEAAEVFNGEIIIARDVMRIPVPQRRRPE